MGFNPREELPKLDTTTIFDLPKMPVVRKRSGKPGEIITKKPNLHRIAISEIGNNTCRPAAFVNSKPSPLIRYYVEWWEIGDPESAINVGEFSCRNIKHVVKLVIADGKRSIVFISRVKDGKVIWDRRAK
jgi:hypothetical protein